MAEVAAKYQKCEHVERGAQGDWLVPIPFGENIGILVCRECSDRIEGIVLRTIVETAVKKGVKEALKNQPRRM